MFYVADIFLGKINIEFLYMVEEKELYIRVIGEIHEKQTHLKEQRLTCLGWGKEWFLEIFSR